MGKSAGRRDFTRERVAQLAARLIAEEGIQDFAFAKRKAAQRLGVPASHHLPNNAEVEEALRTFQGLFQKDEQSEWLAYLRREALYAMRLLERFNPYLTGSVLSGTANRHSDVNLHLYTDSAKEVELFLLDRGVSYRSGERRIQRGEAHRAVPVFTVKREGTVFNIVVFPHHDLRTSLRGPDGSSPGRAKAAQVAELLGEEGLPPLNLAP